MPCRKGHRIQSICFIIGVASVFILLAYFDIPNDSIATSQLHKVKSINNNLYTVQKFNINSSRKYSMNNEGLLWNEHIVKENRPLNFKCGHTLVNEAMENITISVTDNCSQQRFLVYKCDSSRLCGGWGDRQKGIVGTFLLALLTNRVFVIDIDKPCKLDNILLPNIYNWTACYNYVKTVPANKVIKSNYIDNWAKVKGIQMVDYDRTWTKQVVVVRFNLLATEYVRRHKLAPSRLKWLNNITNVEAIHLVYHTLFKPGTKLLHDASKFFEKFTKGKKLTCSHIRMGKNPSILSDASLEKPNVTALFQFLKNLKDNRTHVIYIATDSDEIRLLARKNIQSYININRTIVHVDRLGKYQSLKNEACKGFATAVLEQFILTLCDTLVLTRSGFGIMAAIIRGQDDNIFIFHPKSHTIVASNLTNLLRVL